MDMKRLEQQITFLMEMDKLKKIVRRTLLLDESRCETDAEHSWHIALAAILLAEHMDADGMDMGKALKMILVHDIVEIDAGDTFAYDAAGNTTKEEREKLAAGRLFGFLPADQGQELRALWEEFEEGCSAEARLARLVDTFMPVLHNYATEGRQWKAHGVTRDQVNHRVRTVEKGSAALGDYIQALLDSAVQKGFLFSGDEQ